MVKELCSICCLSYNHADYIKYAVESFFNQTYKNIEIIALDDGSSDKSVDILNELKNSSSVPFTVLTQENSGNIGANFNKLFKHSNGEYIIFIALDDALTEGFIEEQIHIMKNNSRILMSGTTVPFLIDENNNILPNNSLKNDLEKSSGEITPKILLELEYRKAHSVFIQGCLFKRELISNVGGFDEDIIGDDIVLRTKIYQYLINNPEYRLYIQRKSGFYYRRHSSNVSINTVRFVFLLAQYYNKYWNDKPVTKYFKKYLIEVFFTSDYDKIFNLIKSNDYFIRAMLETPELAQAYYSNNSKNSTFNYYTFSIPLFHVKKYKNFITGKKFKEICILGIKFRI